MKVELSPEQIKILRKSLDAYAEALPKDHIWTPRFLCDIQHLHEILKKAHKESKQS